MIQIDWQPEGLVEKAGAALGFDDRQVKADAVKFKDFIESRGQTGSCAATSPGADRRRRRRRSPRGDGAVVRPGGGYSASRSCCTMPAICSSTVWSSLVTITSAPCLAPSVMIINGEPASTGLPPGVARVTGTPALPTASAMSAAGRACSPTRDPTVTV